MYLTLNSSTNVAELGIFLPDAPVEIGQELSGQRTWGLLRCTTSIVRILTHVSRTRISNAAHTNDKGPSIDMRPGLWRTLIAFEHELGFR
jgi:hypothetical protein